MSQYSAQEIGNKLKNGQIGVMPSDTIYGIFGSALIPDIIEKIYTLRKRDLDKPMIILIDSATQLQNFSIELDNKTKQILEKLWPNPVSVILPCNDHNFFYLHRGTHSLAFRIPKDQRLLEILKISGPLVAPSANIQGQPPATNIKEAKSYFPKDVDFFEEGEITSTQPSTVIEVINGEIKVIRPGAFEIPKI